MVDLIFQPSGGPIGDEHFDRAERLEVMAQPMLVAALDDVLVTKVLSLREQELDGPVLELSRSLREQVDWAFVRAQTGPSPFARAFFRLVEQLGIVASDDGSATPLLAAPRGRASTTASGGPAAARHGGT